MNPSAVIAILVCFLFSALYSGSETGSYMINHIRLRHRVLRRQHSARVLAWVLQDPHIFIFSVLIGNNIAVYYLSKTVTDLYLGSGIDGGGHLFGLIPWNAEMASTFTLTLPLFILAEAAPKNFFRKKADWIMYRLADVLRLSVWCFYPFTFVLKHLFHLLTRGISEEGERELHRLSPDGLKEYFSAGAKEGVISSYQSRMMDNATSMHRVSVRALMTPFKQVPSLPDTATVADFKRLSARRNVAFAMLMHRHHVVGVISMFAIVNRKLENQDVLKPYAEDVLSLEENRNLKSAFYRLRRNPRHSAVIVDALKHPVGLVRLEDIARYIAQK